MSDERRIADLTTATTLTNDALLYAQEPMEVDPEIADKKITVLYISEKIATLLFGSTTPALTANTTVNLLTTDTAAQKQALIDAQPKNLNGRTLSFIFADGTHNHSATLTFSGFFGGNLTIRGNNSDTSAAATKAVTIAMGANNVSAIDVTSCACNAIFVNYLAITGSGWANTTDNIIRFQQASNFVVAGVTIISSGGKGRFYCQRNVMGQIINGYFANMGYMLYLIENCHFGENGSTLSSNVVDVFTSQSIVLTSRSTATISKNSGQISLNGVWQ